MPFTIVRQDITKMNVDAVVNAANTALAMGGGVCGAIFQAAGADQLQKACRRQAPIHTGEAVLTPGFALPAQYIIHAAGPVYDPKQIWKSEQLLRSAYMESLRMAAAHQCTSIAFPLISSGIYGYPKQEALRIATAAIKDFLSQQDMDIYLAVFDKDSFAVSAELLGKVESYIDETYAAAHSMQRRELLAVESADIRAVSSRSPGGKPGSLDDWIGHLDEPFSTTLLRLIDARGKTDAEVYKRANIDRRLFSKIRKGNGYLPGKRTALALAIALELTLEETDDLLERAGYALSHSQKFDVIIEYFILNGIYDIFTINEVLFQYDQPLLGAG